MPGRDWCCGRVRRTGPEACARHCRGACGHGPEIHRRWRSTQAVTSIRRACRRELRLAHEAARLDLWRSIWECVRPRRTVAARHDRFRVTARPAAGVRRTDCRYSVERGQVSASPCEAVDWVPDRSRFPEPRLHRCRDVGRARARRLLSPRSAQHRHGVRAAGERRIRQGRPVGSARPRTCSDQREVQCRTRDSVESAPPVTSPMARKPAIRSRRAPRATLRAAGCLRAAAARGTMGPEASR